MSMTKNFGRGLAQTSSRRLTSPIFEYTRAQFHHFLSSKDGLEPYGKLVSPFCELHIDLRRVKLGPMYPRRWNGVIMFRSTSPGLV